MSMPPTSTAHTVNTAPIMNTYQLARFSFGKARSFAPIIIGMKKFPITAGIDGMRKKKSIIMPWAVNSLVVGVLVEDRPGRREQVEPHDAGRDPADTKNAVTKQVEDADPLVVGGQQPRPDAVVVVEIVRLGRRGLGGGGGGDRARPVWGIAMLMASSPAMSSFAGRIGAPTALGVRSVRSGV